MVSNVEDYFFSKAISIILVLEFYVFKVLEYKYFN